MENINELVNKVNNDLSKYIKYNLSEEQLDELRLTGRLGISVKQFAEYLSNAVCYLNNNKSACWYLSLNVVTNEIEITLSKYQQILF